MSADGDIPPGYERYGEQVLRLIDPRACRDGHPWADCVSR